MTLLLASCQQATKVSDVSNSRYEFLIKKLDEPILLGEKTVIFDSRPKFQYLMYSLPGAIHLTWEQLLSDPSIDNSVVKGDKAFYSARRLARLGVNPKSEVIIVGSEERGQARAGRLAWSLLTMGFNNIQVTSIESVKKSLTPFNERKHKSIPIWKPTDRTILEISTDEFINAIRNSEENLLVLDVRSDKEMQKVNLKGLKKNLAKFKSVYIPWVHFYNEKGRPNKKFLRQLNANGVTTDQNIIVISNEGIRSASVTYALLALGFPSVRNLSAGYKSLYK